MMDETYRCRVCGFLNFKSKPEGLKKGFADTVTKKGTYRDACTPTPAEYAYTLYAASTISFVAETATDPAKLQDSLGKFKANLLRAGDNIRIATTSGTNDGDYTIADRGCSGSEILLSTDDSLTTEDAATAGEVTISRIIAKPNVSTGCPFCGSLNSR